MNVNLEKYAHKRICVAVSGGKDSMALLHYLLTHCSEYGITLSALNCDHSIRGKESERDSAFVKAYCEGNGIPLYSFTAQKGAFKDENGARSWRLSCYADVLKEGKADVIATAHHMNDVAETVIFNLARGTALGGLCGISDEPSLGLIRPLTECSRSEIDEYISANNVPFVTDETNFTDDYTRNKIRHNVLPALEQAVHGAVGAIYRFTKLAAEDEDYFARKTQEIIIKRTADNYLIKPCAERVIFKRAAQRIVAEHFHKCDYTAEHLQKLFELQSLGNGKKFEFLGLTAIKESGGVAINREKKSTVGIESISFYSALEGEQPIELTESPVYLVRKEDLQTALREISKGFDKSIKTLTFDIDRVPSGAVIRLRRSGDRFTKFGGGTKSLSDYLTDKKIPQSMRGKLPLVCIGNEVLIVGGVEISDKVKISKATKNKGVFICKNPI